MSILRLICGCRVEDAGGGSPHVLEPCEEMQATFDDLALLTREATVRLGAEVEGRDLALRLETHARDYLARTRGQRRRYAVRIDRGGS